jgi:hypothetical protein
MKRSEAIKDIVKKSYAARAKALNEAKGDKKFSPGDDQAPTATATAAAATSNAPAAGASGASPGGGGGGGSSTSNRVKVVPLIKEKANLKKGDNFLALADDVKKKVPASVIVLVANQEENAALAIADDAELAKENQKLIEAMEIADLVIEEVEQPDGSYKEVEVLKDPFVENGALIEGPVLLNRDLEPELIQVCIPGVECEGRPKAYNVYEVQEDNPALSDIVLVKDNNPEIKAKI